MSQSVIDMSNHSTSQTILHKIWVVCGDFVAQMSELTVEAPFPLQLPLQVLLLTIRWLDLESVSWIDVLRIARRSGEDISCGTQPLMLNRTAFIQTIEEAIRISFARLQNPSEELDIFLLRLWDSSLELSKLREFFDLSFFQVNGFAPASIFTATVIDVFAAYNERWQLLISAIERFGMNNLEGLLVAVHSFLSLDSISSNSLNVVAIFDSAPTWLSIAFGTTTPASLGEQRVSSNKMWELLLFVAVAMKRATPSRVTLWNATQIRSAALEILGDCLGSLLLPPVAWRERVRIGCVRTLSLQEERQSIIRREMETTLRQLYIHISGHGDQIGVSLATSDKIAHFLIDCKICSRHSDRALLRAVASILEVNGIDANSLLSNLSQGSNPSRVRSSKAVPYGAFVNVIEHLSRVGPATDTASLGDFLRSVINTDFGREARRSVAREVAEGYQKDSSAHLELPQRVFSCLASRNHEAITASVFSDVAVRSGVVPSMCSRADVARILRSIVMDHLDDVHSPPAPELVPLGISDFIRFVSTLARLPKLPLSPNQSQQVILHCMTKYLERETHAA